MGPPIFEEEYGRAVYAFANIHFLISSEGNCVNEIGPNEWMARLWESRKR